jgi:hypothetical protein
MISLDTVHGNCRGLDFPGFFFTICNIVLQAVLSEISAGLPDNQPSAATSLNGSLGDLASLTAGEAGGLGGLDFEDEPPHSNRYQPDIVQTADHAYQVCDYSYQRLNMDVDLQTLFGLHVT